MPVNNYKSIGIILLIVVGSSLTNKVTAQNTPGKRPAMQAVETGFIHIPDSILTSVYWYWMSDNISKQGVINDLEAMKKVGINRAFIGNIGGQNVPYGKVKLFSDEWWDILHAALKTATKLNIEIGIFNGPGWSQSGGPWVKPAQSMRYLTSSEIKVKGPALTDQEIPVPEKDFQDVKVIAYPAPVVSKELADFAPVFVVSGTGRDLHTLYDRDFNTGIEVKEGEKFTLDITAASFTARSLLIYPLHSGIKLEGDIQAEEHGVYKTVRHFFVDHSNTALNVGFKPFAPAVFSLPATTATKFRIVLTNLSNGRIAEIKLSSNVVVDNYIDKTLAKTWQTPLPYWDAYQWPVAPVIDDNKYIIDPGKIIDISRYLSADGKIKWNVPAGDWIIERCGMVPTGVTNSPATPEGTGPETDKMSRQHIEAHFNAFLGEIIRRIPAEDRKTWKVSVEDSYETGAQNWTDGLIETFKAAYGYDPTPYMPVLEGKVVGSADQSDRFLWDLRRFVADKLAYEYVGGLRDISHKHGLHTWLETYGHWGFPGEFLQYGGQSDEVGGEFWSFGDLGNIENRDASSCAHIYGKTRVSAESFTGADPAFSRYPGMLKQRVDRFFTEGINSTLLHVYISQPREDQLPGLNAWFGNEFNRHNTWFYDMDVFLQYIKRCNFMLQQGKYVADIAYFIGEDVPKMTGVQDPPLPRGYSFDYMNAEVIQTRLSVKNGKLVLPDGMQYSILVLPKLETMRPELLLKIKTLVSQGAVVLGPRPSRSPSLQNFNDADQQVQATAAMLWGDINGSSVKINHFGKGMVIDGMDLQQAMDMLNIGPDLKINNDSVLFIHRALPGGDIYFISNQKNNAVKTTGEFRVAGKTPELWDALTGKMRPLPQYTQTHTGTMIPIELDALGSSFIVFRKTAATTQNKVALSNYPAPVKIIDIKGAWSVKFDHKMRGPGNDILFNDLTDWTANSNDSIKYYSGSAWYRKTIINNVDLKKGETVWLDLGSVKAISKVTINGIEVGGAWIAPFKTDITRALKPGTNILQIKVTNTWVNRIIGDQALPEKERKTWLTTNPYSATSRLLPSGLLGPVKLEIMKY